jgi:hypothetical protein
MTCVYILRGSRRHYIGATNNLDRRIAEDKRGSNHTTLRFGDHVGLVSAKVSVPIGILIASGAVPQPTEWQRTGNQIDAAMTSRRAGFR